MCRAIAILGAAVVALLLAGCGGSKALPLQCASKPRGALCIKVFQHGRSVRDVIGYLAASEPILAGRKWQLALAIYPCDPGTGSVPSCIPAKIFPGPTRQGDPPLATSCRTADGATTTIPTGCHDTLAQETASFGAFVGFHPPKSFTSEVWLCIEEKVVQGRPTAPPARACSAV